MDCIGMEIKDRIKVNGEEGMVMRGIGCVEGNEEDEGREWSRGGKDDDGRTS